jgi:uncharacterized repeat protein (TIGR03803 family)
MKSESKPVVGKRVVGSVDLKKMIKPKPASWTLPLAILALAVIATPAARAQTYTTLHSFCPATGCKGGADPLTGLAMDSAGNLFGTTGGGGTICSGGFSGGCGTVFKMAGRSFSVLYKFKGGLDGAAPFLGNMIVDAKGDLYGVTQVGGGGGCVFGGPPGCGTVFKMTGTKETVLHSFTGPDGAEPTGYLVTDSAGNIYGTTISGGAHGNGAVFKLDTSGTETALYSFCPKIGCADGSGPYGGLITDANGNLYGTTWGGGAGAGYGTVFKVTKDGKETVLYSFCSMTGCADGSSPIAGLIMDASGNLYGTTYFGGTGVCPQTGNNGCGTVFKLDTNGTETVLHSFCSKTSCSDGLFPSAGLLRDAKGNLYGTTTYGGTGNCPDSNGGCGTVFKVDPSGNETVLHSFTGIAPDGLDPEDSLVMDANGSLYGTTAGGGKFDRGVVFKLTP